MNDSIYKIKMYENDTIEPFSMKINIGLLSGIASFSIIKDIP